MDKKQISVNILDQNFTLKTDGSPEKAQKIADYLNDQMTLILKKSKGLSNYNAAILVAFNITEKYFSTLEKQNQLKSRVAEKSKKILGILNTQKPMS